MSDDEDVEGSAAEHGVADGATEHVKLTPKQVETPLLIAASIQRSWASQIKLPAFTLPASMFQDIAAIARIAETQQVLAANALKPFLDAQSAWQRQFAATNSIFISSDIFKRVALAQSNLNLVASQLTKNIDFGLAESVAKVAANFAEQQATWLRSIDLPIAAMRANFYPPNLRAIEGLKFEEVEQVVMVDGIPLYGLPRTATAEALIRAEGASERRMILGRRWKGISADCRMAVEGCTSESAAPYLRHQFRQPGLQVPPAHRVARRRCEGRRRHTAMPDPVRPAEFVVHLGREGNEFVPFRRRSRPARRTDGCGTVGSGAHHRSGNRRPIVTRISCPPPVILSSVPLILWGVIATIRGSGFERRAHAAALFVIESVVRRSSVLHNERVRSRQDGQMRVDHKDASASFVVTGASGGIGQVISKHLSAVGHVVNLDPTPAHNTDARVHCLEVDAGDPPQRSRPLNPPRSMPPWSAG